MSVAPPPGQVIIAVRGPGPASNRRPLPPCPAARTRPPRMAGATLTLGFLRHRLRESGNPLVLVTGELFWVSAPMTGLARHAAPGLLTQQPVRARPAQPHRVHGLRSPPRHVRQRRGPGGADRRGQLGAVGRARRAVGAGRDLADLLQPPAPLFPREASPAGPPTRLSWPRCWARCRRCCPTTRPAGRSASSATASSSPTAPPPHGRSRCVLRGG